MTITFWFEAQNDFPEQNSSLSAIEALVGLFFLFKIMVSLVFIFKEKEKDVNTFLALFWAYSQNLVLTAQFKLCRLPLEASIISFHPRPLKSEFWWVRLRHWFLKKLFPGDLNV